MIHTAQPTAPRGVASVADQGFQLRGALICPSVLILFHLSSLTIILFHVHVVSNPPKNLATVWGKL